MRQLALQRLKRAALASCRYSGLFALARRLTADGVRILAYHRFTRQPNAVRDVSLGSFERQIAYLKKHFRVLSLVEFRKALSGEQALPRAAAMVTIDDGYADAYTVAYPVLKKYGVPATIFLPADFIDGLCWLWPDKLSYGLSRASRRQFALPWNGGSRAFDLSRGWPAVKWQLDELCTAVDTGEREALIAELLEELGVALPERPTPQYSPLSWAQIREMDKGPISFGSHTCSHPILSRLGAEEARKEIARSKARLEEGLQHEIEAFCYPNGTAADFTSETVRLVQESGYKCAFTTIYGLNGPGADPYRLKRLVQCEAPLPRFLQDVSGLRLLRERLRPAQGHGCC